ncbi:MAG: DUF924 family protein [Steroidobacteraceae bacterium]
MSDRARQVLDYWFGPAAIGTEDALNARMGFWFGGQASPEVIAMRDQQIELRFGDLVRQAMAGELAQWAASPRRRLALIILLDQFPRSIHRGKAEAFAGDEAALRLTLEGMQLGADAALTAPERLFFYMPLQHAESLEIHDESLAAFRRLVAEAPMALKPVFVDVLNYADLHRSIVARFGRFPHRNAALGRPSSDEELRYLADSAPRFGQ